MAAGPWYCVQMEVKHAAEVEGLRHDLARVQREAAENLTELMARQEAVEAEAPILAEAVAEAKANLKDLIISETMYEEIAQVVIGTVPQFHEGA